MQGSKDRLLIYLKNNQYLGILSWLGNFPNFIIFNVDGKSLKFQCQGVRDWSHGKEGIYTEDGMRDDFVNQIAVGCKPLEKSRVRPLNKDDNDFLSSMGVKW